MKKKERLPNTKEKTTYTTTMVIATKSTQSCQKNKSKPQGVLMLGSFLLLWHVPKKKNFYSSSWVQRIWTTMVAKAWLTSWHLGNERVHKITGFSFYSTGTPAYSTVFPRCKVGFPPEVILSGTPTQTASEMCFTNILDLLNWSSRQFTSRNTVRKAKGGIMYATQ